MNTKRESWRRYTAAPGTANYRGPALRTRRHSRVTEEMPTPSAADALKAVERIAAHWMGKAMESCEAGHCREQYFVSALIHAQIEIKALIAGEEGYYERMLRKEAENAAPRAAQPETDDE